MGTIDKRPRAERAVLLEAYYSAERQKALERLHAGPVLIKAVLRASDLSFRVVVRHWGEAEEIIAQAASYGLENDGALYFPWEIDHLVCTSQNRGNEIVPHYRGDIFIADLPKRGA